MVHFKPHTSWKHTSQADALKPKVYFSRPSSAQCNIRHQECPWTSAQTFRVQSNFMCTDHV